MRIFTTFKSVEFSAADNGSNILTISATRDGKEIGACFVNKAGDFFGHIGAFASGFENAEVEKFAQDVFDAEIEKWING